jgi:hypothetical protein
MDLKQITENDIDIKRKKFVIWNEDEDDIFYCSHIDKNMLKQITGNDKIITRNIGKSGKKWKISDVYFPNGNKKIVLHEILDSKL